MEIDMSQIVFGETLPVSSERKPRFGGTPIRLLKTTDVIIRDAEIRERERNRHREARHGEWIRKATALVVSMTISEMQLVIRISEYFERYHYIVESQRNCLKALIYRYSEEGK